MFANEDPVFEIRGLDLILYCEMPTLRAQIDKIPGYLTVADLSIRWGGVSTGPIFKLIKQGALKATKFGRLNYITEASIIDVESFGMRPKQGRWTRDGTYERGWRVAEAFRMFRDGKDLVDVVTALNITVDEVDRLYAQYMNRDLSKRLLENE